MVSIPHQHENENHGLAFYSIVPADHNFILIKLQKLTEIFIIYTKITRKDKLTEKLTKTIRAMSHLILMLLQNV